MNMRPMRKVLQLCVHHSAGASGSVEEFRREHKAKGWADVGYHGVIGNGHGQADGLVLPAREEKWEGAGVFGANEGVVHVCMVGNFDLTVPTGNQLRGLGQWLVNRERRYGNADLGTFLPVYGHNELSVPGHRTACPGAWWTDHHHGRLGLLRDWLYNRLYQGEQRELDVFLALNR